MAAASKGKYQAVCDCSLYEKWGGYSKNSKKIEFTLIEDNNEDDSKVGNKIIEQPVKIEDDSFFNRIYFTYTSKTIEPVSFYVKYLCLIGSDGACLPVDPKEVNAVRYLDGKHDESDDLNLTIKDVGQLFTTGEARLGLESAFRYGAMIEVVLNNKVRYRDIKSVIWNYYSDDCCGVKRLSVGTDINLYKDGDLVVHYGNLWAAYGDINDMDDEPSKSIHWEFLCSCERDPYRIETPTPTPSPTPTATPTPSPTPTPTYEDIICWCDEYAPWHEKHYDWKDIVSYNGYLYQAHDYQGTEPMDVPGTSNHWFEVCRCIEGCYPREICVNVEEGLGWDKIELEHTGKDCLGNRGSVVFTEETGIPKFNEENKLINAVRFSYEGSNENPIHFNTEYFAFMRNDTILDMGEYMLIDPFGNEAQHVYCAGENNEVGSHGLSGNVADIFEENSNNWGIPITSCNGYFTIFFKNAIDISAVNKVVWKYNCGANCGVRKISFRNVEKNPLTNGTYELADPAQDWKLITDIRQATDHNSVGYVQKFGNNRICSNKPKRGKRRPTTAKMPLAAYSVDNFKNVSTQVILASEVTGGTWNCASGFDNIIPTYGDNTQRPSVGGVSIKLFQAGGKLAFNDLNLNSALAGQPGQYGVTIETGNETVYGMLNTTAPFVDNEIMYISTEGKYYKGTLESQSGFDNVLEYAGVCTDDVNEPTPTPTKTPTLLADIDSTILLESKNLDLNKKVWFDSNESAFHASIGGEPELDSSECDSGINLRGNGSFISFPTYARKMPIISFGITFEIKGNGVVVAEGKEDRQFLVFQQNVRVDEYEGFYLAYDTKGIQTGCLTAGVKPKTGNEFAISSTENSIKWNTKYHAHVVLADSQIKLFINGELTESGSKPSGIDYHPTQRLHLGRANATGSQNDCLMNGSIYGFELYEGELSNAYVKQIFENSKCPPTPTPTPSPTESPTPTPTIVLDEDCLDYPDDRTWTMLNSDFIGYGSKCIVESVWENTSHNSWKVSIEEGNCGEVECCRSWLNKYEVGPEIDTIVDGANQITIGKQLYAGEICVDRGKGDIENLLINEVTLYIEENKPVGTVIFMGNVMEHTTIYFTITNSDKAEKYGYPYLTDKCYRGTIENGICMLKEYG